MEVLTARQKHTQVSLLYTYSSHQVGLEYYEKFLVKLFMKYRYSCILDGNSILEDIDKIADFIGDRKSRTWKNKTLELQLFKISWLLNIRVLSVSDRFLLGISDFNLKNN